MEQRERMLTAEERVKELHKRGVLLISRLVESKKIVFDAPFLREIELQDSAAESCVFLGIGMSLEYAEEIMVNFEKEVAFLLSNSNSGVEMQSPWGPFYTAPCNVRCPDESVVAMYDRLFRRLQPAFEMLNVEFEVRRSSQGCRIVIPHKRRMGNDLRRFLDPQISKVKQEFCGFTMELQPTLTCLARIMQLMKILQHDPYSCAG